MTAVPLKGDDPGWVEAIPLANVDHPIPIPENAMSVMFFMTNASGALVIPKIAFGTDATAINPVSATNMAPYPMAAGVQHDLGFKVKDDGNWERLTHLHVASMEDDCTFYVTWLTRVLDWNET